MSNHRLCTALLGGVLLTGSAFAQTCHYAIAASAPDSRYSDNGDETVTDHTTGLMWKQCPEGLSGSGCSSGGITVYTWQLALQLAQTIDSGAGFAGYNDWRLPNRKELLSLVEVKCYAPAANITLFPNTFSDNFWTASPYASSADSAWVVTFYSGVDSYDAKVNAHYVRLVRGGQ